MTFKISTETITVIKINDMYLVNLFGMCDGEEIFLENDMNDYILEEVENGNIDEEDIADIEKLQEVIRECLKTSRQVKVEYSKM